MDFSLFSSVVQTISSISTVIETIGKLVTREVTPLWGVKDQVEDLKKELKWMQSFLEEAVARKINNKVVLNSVSEIRELAYDAEDVIESFALKVASRRRGGISNVIKRCACILNEGWLLCQTKCEIERITTRITKLHHRFGPFKLDDDKSRDEAGSSQRQELRRSYPYIPDDNVVGLADDIKALVPVLIDENSDCRVVSICGMGGLGKTTLAKRIYHHSQVIGHFDHLAWVYISQQCQKRKVWEDILSGLKILANADRKRRDEEVAEKLYDFLRYNKCLVILDDIWNTEAWDLLKPALPVERDTKTKFLLTSRHKEVILHADRRGHMYELQCLNEEQSRELLQKIAFPQTGNSVDARMKGLGEEMLHHCAGLPLAIIVLGGVLANKNTVSEWQKVLDNLKRGRRPSTHENEVLALSYDDLPPYLIPCFLYLSVFPEDYEIKADRLIQLWVAEGIVSSEDDEGEIVEDAAERRLAELAERCMVQVVERSPTLRIGTCRMHDLMRELSLLKAKKEEFVCIMDNPSFPPSFSRVVRRVVSHRFVLSGRIKSCPLRSILFFSNSFKHPDDLVEAFLSPKMFKYFEEHKDDSGCCQLLLLCCFLNWRLHGYWRYLFSNFKLLRVLHFDGSFSDGGCKLPSALGNLIHLRFLNLEGFEFLCTKIPSSLGNLRCLQTLDLRILNRELCWDIYVPDVIWKLEELRHLYLPRDMSEETKLKLHTLRNLQTLVNFNTENCFAADLSKQTNLRKLKIRSFNLEDFKEVLDKNQPIIASKYLQSLSIGVYEGIDAEVLGHLLSSCVDLCELKLQGEMKKLPEHHHFSSTIAYIRLKECSLEEDPMPTLEQLPNLRVLKLESRAFNSKKMVCSASQFPQLESLTFSHLRDLEEWKVEEGAMPALRHLKIQNCRHLEMLPDGLRFIKTLQKLIIEEMPKEFKHRTKEGGEDFYKIQHVPPILFSRMD